MSKRAVVRPPATRSATAVRCSAGSPGPGGQPRSGLRGAHGELGSALGPLLSWTIAQKKGNKRACAVVPHHRSETMATKMRI